MIPVKLRQLFPHPKYCPNKLLEFRLDRSFYKAFGYHINFKTPKSFNERMQSYRLYYRNPDLCRVSDKIEFKNYVREKIGEGYTAKLLGVWDNVESIDLSKLTPPYVLKSNCAGFGRNILFVRDSNIDIKKIRELVRPWLKESRCISWAFWSIKPLIFAEEMIGGSKEGLTDYKFFCFDGKPFCIYTAVEHFADGVARPSKITFYDTNWNVLDVTYKGHESSPVERPKHFEEMKELAARLSYSFPFMRVDFYDTDEKLYLGELTYDSSNGRQPFSPESFDYQLGEMFHFPSDRVP